MLLGSKAHTAGDTRRWVIKYGKWLDNTAEVQQIAVTSSSVTCTVANTQTLGNDIIFFLTGGAVGETLTVALEMTDSLGNIKNDTINYTVVAP